MPKLAKRKLVSEKEGTPKISAQAEETHCGTPKKKSKKSRVRLECHVETIFDSSLTNKNQVSNQSENDQSTRKKKKKKKLKLKLEQTEETVLNGSHSNEGLVSTEPKVKKKKFEAFDSSTVELKEEQSNKSDTPSKCNIDQVLLDSIQNSETIDAQAQENIKKTRLNEHSDTTEAQQELNSRKLIGTHGVKFHGKFKETLNKTAFEQFRDRGVKLVFVLLFYALLSFKFCRVKPFKPPWLW